MSSDVWTLLPGWLRYLTLRVGGRVELDEIEGLDWAGTGDWVPGSTTPITLQQEIHEVHCCIDMQQYTCNVQEHPKGVLHVVSSTWYESNVLSTVSADRSPNTIRESTVHLNNQRLERISRVEKS